MRNRIVFGDASYIKDGVVKARRLKRGEGWKQSYVAVITGLDDQHGLKREFLKMKGEAPTGKPIMSWIHPTTNCILELGWWSMDVAQKEPVTIYLMVLYTDRGLQYLEITEAQAYREMNIKSTEKPQ